MEDVEVRVSDFAWREYQRILESSQSVAERSHWEKAIPKVVPQMLGAPRTRTGHTLGPPPHSAHQWIRLLIHCPLLSTLPVKQWIHVMQKTAEYNESIFDELAAEQLAALEQLQEEERQLALER